MSIFTLAEDLRGKMVSHFVIECDADHCRMMCGINEDQWPLANAVDLLDVKSQQRQPLFPRQTREFEVYTAIRPSPDKLVGRHQRDRLAIQARPHLGFAFVDNLSHLPAAEAAAQSMPVVLGHDSRSLGFDLR